MKNFEILKYIKKFIEVSQGVFLMFNKRHNLLSLFKLSIVS